MVASQILSYRGDEEGGQIFSPPCGLNSKGLEISEKPNGLE